MALTASVLTFSQAATADVSISGWINEGVTYYDDGNSSDVVSTADNGTTLGSRITFAGSTDLPAGLNAGFEVILEPRTDSDGVLGFGSTGAPFGSPDSFSNATGDTIN
ncbi:MAG TPA: porin, partial [Gammaproteobacteria bacterium]|nr:porin [Gammaproteobacteria bacterium]